MYKDIRSSFKKITFLILDALIVFFEKELYSSIIKVVTSKIAGKIDPPKTHIWFNSVTKFTYSNIYRKHLSGIKFALKQKVIEPRCIVNYTTKLHILMVTCWKRKMMQCVHELKALLQLSSSVLFNATLTFPFMLLL